MFPGPNASQLPVFFFYVSMTRWRQPVSLEAGGWRSEAFPSSWPAPSVWVWGKSKSNAVYKKDLYSILPNRLSSLTLSCCFRRAAATEERFVYSSYYSDEHARARWNHWEQIVLQVAASAKIESKAAFPSSNSAFFYWIWQVMLCKQNTVQSETEACRKLRTYFTFSDINARFCAHERAT